MDVNDERIGGCGELYTEKFLSMTQNTAGSELVFGKLAFPAFKHRGVTGDLESAGAWATGPLQHGICLRNRDRYLILPHSG